MQKNHRLIYLSHEGPIHDDKEKIKIIKRGVFFSHSWILSENLFNTIRLSWGIQKTENCHEKTDANTDLKLNENEVILYAMPANIY